MSGISEPAPVDRPTGPLPPIPKEDPEPSKIGGEIVEMDSVLPAAQPNEQSREPPAIRPTTPAEDKRRASLVTSLASSVESNGPLSSGNEECQFSMKVEDYQIGSVIGKLY